MKKTKRELLVLAAATTVALLMGVTVQAKGDEKVLNFGCQMYTDGCVNSANDENSGWNAMRYGIAEALFKFDDDMEVIPWLAESYEVNDEHTEWTIKLKDGVGIEKDDLKHIFERLYKCDKGRSEKGSGLGLSIVHQLVEKMGGSITVESFPGEGTEFMLLFPLEI